MMSKKAKKILVLGLILIGFPLLFIYIGKSDHNFASVVYFPINEDIEIKEGVMPSADIYATIPHFEFVNQDGGKVSSDDYINQIYVADFFFTTCPTICPVMTTQMNQLIWQLDRKGGFDMQYVSFTVDPEHDTPAVLSQYVEKNEINTEIWTLLTGDKDEIYKLGVNGFRLPAQEDALAPGGFLHSNMFVLVDEENFIRGYYDGTNSQDIRLLAGDIKKLVSEKNQKERAKRKKL